MTMRTIRQFVDDWAKKQPDKVFLIAPEPERQMTFNQLREYSLKLSKYLKKQNITKGDKVSFISPNGFQTTRLFLGIMYGGFVVSPINIAAQISHLIYILEHSDTKLVFVSEDYKEQINLAMEKVSRAIEIVPFDIDAEEIVDGDISPDTNLFQVEEDDDALLLYTSGTTGLPKGAILSHKAVVEGGLNVQRAHGINENDRAYCALTLTHINGEIVTGVAPLVTGGSVVMPHRFGVTRFWDDISKYKCTWCSVVPTIISYLYHKTDPFKDGYNIESLKFVRSASSPLPESLHHDFENKYKTPIIETMGFTEAAAPGFSNLIEKRKYGSVGIPVGNEAKIVDQITRKDVPVGYEGEIVIRGDNIMKEYYKDPEKTRKAMDDEGWYYTGDLAKMDKDGFVFVTGRLKELIIKGGENIAPREIDDVLYSHPDVVDAAAFSVPDENYGENIEAAVTVSDNSNINENELLDYAAKQLTRTKTPRRIHIIDEMPKGPSGKLQRFKLQDIIYGNS